MGTHLPLSATQRGQTIDFDDGRETSGRNSNGNATRAITVPACHKRVRELRLSSLSTPNGEVLTDDIDLDTDKRKTISNGSEYTNINETSTNCENNPPTTLDESSESVNGIVITIDSDSSNLPDDQTDSSTEAEMRFSAELGQEQGHQYSPLTRHSNPEGNTERLSGISGRIALVAQANVDAALEGQKNDREEMHKKKTLSLRRVKVKKKYLLSCEKIFTTCVNLRFI